jgi:hypothetical protein
MTPPGETDARVEAVDIGAYCRRVESHLTQVNAGHLVRIVGPGFELVRRWAEAGVPLSIVMRGVERRAERHRRGGARRPLRIEFCEADVREVFDEWRRAIGFAPAAGAAAGEAAGAAGARRRPSLSAHLERAIDRLGRATGRLDWPDAFRDGLEACRAELSALHKPGDRVRGAARDAAVAELERLDARLLELAYASMPEALLREARRDAEADLAAYRGRLPPELWQRSVDVTAARLLRDRLGLPTLVP